MPRMKDPVGDWFSWQEKPAWALWEAVLLWVNYDPIDSYLRGLQASEPDEGGCFLAPTFNRLFLRVLDAVEKDKLVLVKQSASVLPRYWRVAPRDFATWALKQNISDLGDFEVSEEFLALDITTRRRKQKSIEFSNEHIESILRAIAYANSFPLGSKPDTDQLYACVKKGFKGTGLCENKEGWKYLAQCIRPPDCFEKVGARSSANRGDRKRKANKRG